MSEPPSGVDAAMRSHALALALALAGCTSAEPPLDLRGEGDPMLPDLPFVRIPDGEPSPPAPAAETPEPAEPPATGDRPRFTMSGEGTFDDCFSVSAVGLPAIDVTGSFVATTHAQYLQLTPAHGLVELRIRDLADPESSSVHSIVGDYAFASDDADCASLRARTRRRVAAANAELAREHWRTMDVLPVEYAHPDVAPEIYREPAPSERPLQIVAQHGEVIVRIPGVKVYERHSVPNPRGAWLYSVHGDRDTGVVVLTFADCAGDSCTCDPMLTTEVVQWSAETFAALDAHPCLDADDPDGECRPIDYGF